MHPTIDLLSAHRSVRKFMDTPVKDALLETLVRAAQCAATSHHVQAYTIIRVCDKGNRQKIAALSGPQPWVEQAPVFLVFCADLTRLTSACDRHNISAETGWAEQFVVATEPGQQRKGSELEPADGNVHGQGQPAPYEVIS